MILIVRHPASEVSVKKDKKFNLFVNFQLCKGVEGCGLCIHVCPKDVYVKADCLTERGVTPPEPVHPELCTGCMLCMMYCPDFAIVVGHDEEEPQPVR